MRRPPQAVYVTNDTTQKEPSVWPGRIADIGMLMFFAAVFTLIMWEVTR
jgi:hypothetical protein